MPAATPPLYFQTLFQHEVLQIISTLNAGSYERIRIAAEGSTLFLTF